MFAVILNKTDEGTDTEIVKNITIEDVTAIKRQTVLGFEGNPPSNGKIGKDRKVRYSYDQKSKTEALHAETLAPTWEEMTLDFF